MSQHSKENELRRLIALINQWNDDHYEIFALSKPNEDLEFHGVMRFFFQDAGAKIATKCIRISSLATTREVVNLLVEKFHPDMRMLTQSNYALYEVHSNEEERKISENENPLIVQLNWGADLRDGRFLLKCENEVTCKNACFENERDNAGFKRKLSRREMKEKKKRQKEKLKNNQNLEKDKSIAEKLYTELPDTSFTRSISNPEAVMRRRRQQKVEKKLQEILKEGGSDSGGMLKVYGESIRPNVPYKTLLVSVTDSAGYVVQEMLDKYGLPKEDSANYCLFQVTVPSEEREYHGGSLGEERILNEDECPLAILMDHNPSQGSLMFQLRSIPPETKRQAERMRAASHNDLRYNHESPTSMHHRLPYLMELHPDGSENPKGRRHYLQLNATKVGSEKSVSDSQYLQLFGPDIHPRHCVIAHMEGTVTVTPTNRDVDIFVNNQRILQTTLLQNGMIVKFGKMHIFRFCDPKQVGARPPDQMLQQQGDPYREKPREGQIRKYETNFDLDGHVETVSGQTPHRNDRAHSREDLKHSNQSGTLPYGQEQPKMVHDLPAALEFREEGEDAFLTGVILDANCNAMSFKLSPAYTLYMAVRYQLSNAFRPEMSPSDRASRLTLFVKKIAGLVQRAIEVKCENPAALAFWMANASEILHFMKQDHDIRLFSHDAQEVLAESVQMAFHHLVRCLQFDLQRTMPAFITDDDSVENDDFGLIGEDGGRMPFNRNKPMLEDVLKTLSAAMNLLRRCRVNAALTIQLFSQLFHYINMWLFNLIVTSPTLVLCTRRWGIRLKRRLGRVETWAEKQGLELAADCHLCRIIQAAHLLQAPKNTADDITNISSTCFKLNSMQIRALIENYVPEDNEPSIPQYLIERVVAIAENMADELTRTDGRDIYLEEDADLQLPFLLPEDGYSCDIIRGIPNGLPEFLEGFIRSGLCRMIPQPQSKGLWTVYMVAEDGPKLSELHFRKGLQPGLEQRPEELPKEPEISVVMFNKVDNSIGLSIVAAKGDKQPVRGIYIKSVVSGGAAYLDGRLQAGDQLLQVDGRNLVGLTQEKAAELMTKTGNIVTLKVAKQGAIYHGLATLLSQPSPTMQRAANKMAPPLQNKPRPRSEENMLYNDPHEEIPGGRQHRHKRDTRDQNTMDGRRYLQPGSQSRSSPSLNSDVSGPEQQRTSIGMQNTNSGPLQQHPHHLREHREDPRSRSTFSLRQDEKKQQKPGHPMRPAMSTGAINHHAIERDSRNSPHWNEGRYPGSKQGQTIYEEQPKLDNPRYLRKTPETIRNEGSPPEPNYSKGPSQGRRPAMVERTGVPVRAPITNQRDERPHSAAYTTAPQDREFSNMRPRSDEMSNDKVREWQEKYDPDRQQKIVMDQYGRDEYSSSEQQNSSYGYSKTISPPREQNQDAPKTTINNQARQQHLYDRTLPRAQEVMPPLNQLPRSVEHEVKKPRVPAKHIPPKPETSPLLPAQDIPQVDVDNRRTQPNFYTNRHPQNLEPFQGMSTYSQVNQFKYQDEKSALQRGKPPGFENSELPPPPDMAPDLPPPPAVEDLQDMLPPPPPPVEDTWYEFQSDVQARHMDQSKYDVRDADYGGYRQRSPQDYQNRAQLIKYADVSDLRISSPTNKLNDGYTDGMRQVSPQNMHNSYANYQNGYSKPDSQPPPVPQLPSMHNNLERYENSVGATHSERRVLPAQVVSPSMHLSLPESGADSSSMLSAWDREEKERAVRQQQEELSRLREQEIADLSQRAYLTPPEEERLRKLRLEHEFQRRVQEVGDDEEDEDSEPEVNRYRQQGRDWLLQKLQSDLMNTQLRIREMDQKQQSEEYEKERMRLQRLEMRLEIFEKEREEERKRMQQKQQQRELEQEEYLRKQRELREKQRRDFEEQKRLHLMEEERIQQERLDEMKMKRDLEREQQQQAAREVEEEMKHQRMAQLEHERLERERLEQLELRKRRLLDPAPYGPSSDNELYHLPENVVGDSKVSLAPTPPERGSSFRSVNHYQQRGTLKNREVLNEQPLGLNVGNRSYSSSAMRTNQDGGAPKKSVSFNSQLETKISTYSDDERSPTSAYSHHSSTSSHSSDPHQRSVYANPTVVMQSLPDEVFGSSTHNSNMEINYRTADTPGVIGTQEVYRDPRTRIQAKKAANSIKGVGPERMSFRDKMKYFAEEAGETAPKSRSKASRVQRDIESQMNGQ